MATPYLGEIKMFGGNFAPVGWALCSGQTLAISQNDALFNLIGTTYGGDGQTTFNLPNLQGRIPIHQGTLQGGQTYIIGQPGGNEAVTLINGQMPAHTHPVSCNSTEGTSADPLNDYWAVGSNFKQYSAASPTVNLNVNAISMAPGGSQPHDNMVPYLVVNFIIALEGVYPSQN